MNPCIPTIPKIARLRVSQPIKQMSKSKVSMTVRMRMRMRVHVRVRVCASVTVCWCMSGFIDCTTVASLGDISCVLSHPLYSQRIAFFLLTVVIVADTEAIPACRTIGLVESAMSTQDGPEALVAFELKRFKW